MAAQDGPVALARRVDARRADELVRELGPGRGRAYGVLLGAAYPALRPVHGWQVDAIEQLAERGLRSTRSREFLLGRLLGAAGSFDDAERVASELRRQAWTQRARVALREILPRTMGGATVDSTARELSHLAEATLEVALAEAVHHQTARSGPPRRHDGALSTVTIIGLGKLGGRELNAGSDVDLMLIYDTDEGAAGELSLHEYWSLVARRLVATMEQPTADGIVWRVDLRLRPEGSQGPIVYSWSATERYYETWGRLWERAALLRARPVAGDRELGAALGREVFQPFVFRREVDPTIATLLTELVQRSRTELRADPERNLKLGRGGIREAEFFVQALQLIWGGRERNLRVPGSLEALSRLQSHGLVTDREAAATREAYLLLRRVEHAVQFRSGIQTHDLPSDPAELDTLGRLLGYRDGAELRGALGRARAGVRERFASLLRQAPRASQRFAVLLGQLEHPTEALAGVAEEQFGTPEVAEHLVRLARRPDGLLGGLTRERYPELVDRVLESLRTCSDPEQAARFLRSFFSGFQSPTAYLAVLSDEPRVVSKLVTVVGASAFVGEAIAARPDLADAVLFGEDVVSVEHARRSVELELERYERELPADAEPNDRMEAFVGALRRAQRRVTVEVAMADLSGEIDTREATRVLSALADAVLDRATTFALGGDAHGLAVIAVGKLGGGDIGYGSDLDVLFVYDPAAAPEGAYAPEHFSRIAQRIIWLISVSHSAGSGYDLDTRLRPSGSQGLLVTSLPAFARYHGVFQDEGPADGLAVTSSGAAWERQALLRARACAGDRELGASVVKVAHAAAYEHGAAPAAELHHLRMRMERELGRERAGRYDLKTGRGGLLDVEFATQWLQMRYGMDLLVRSADTVAALHALHSRGYLSRPAFETLRDGYVFLRKLEQRIRIVHGSGVTTLDATAAGLPKLARRMGIQGTPTQSEAEVLLEDYQETTELVRKTYLEVLGVAE